MAASAADALHSISGKWRSQSQRQSQRSSRRDREVDDEEALKWAALEKLPTYNRLRTAILKNVEEEPGQHGNRAKREQVDVTKLGLHDKRALIENLLRVIEEDNERFLRIVRHRLDSVGIEQPKIEVRFENINVSARVHVGSRALPTLLNYTSNALESVIGLIGLSPSKKRKLDILQDVSGIIKPSRMTLLLGPPSSGKTTMLMALAGKLDPDLKVSGKVTYNGHGLDEFVPQRTAAYISQQDLQSGEMTVRETLDFYGRCQGVGTRYDMLAELSRREKEMGIKPDPDVDAFLKASAVQGQETNVVTDYVLKILGLEICADTLIGDEMRRGISGGQRKRVTTGEMIVGPAKALFMDEISTGLDSSTTFQIVKCLRQFVHFTNGTLLVSLLQPAPETFELFDDLILLSEGQIVYQGPRDLVLDFFESMGFKCPPRKGIADFLQEVTSRKDQHQYWAERSIPYSFVPVKSFAAAFQQFHVGESLKEELERPYHKANSHPAALVKQKYALSKWDLFRACLSREVLLLKRNAFIYVFKTVQIAFLAAIAVTVFLRSKMKHRTVADGNAFMGAIFYGLIVVMFNGAADLSMTIMRLPVFYKQRDSYLYPPWAFALPTWIVKLPVSFVEAGIWIIVTYYGIGFAPEAGRCFRQFLLLFCLHQMSSGLFRFLAAVGRTQIIANTWGNFSLLIGTVLGGFILSRDNIHPWWIWGYWVSPLTYAQNAITVNEFLAPRWQKPFNGSATQTIGKQILEGRGLFAEANWYWIGIGALVGYSLLFNILFTWALTYLNPLGKPQALISEEALEEKQANLTGAEVGLRTRSLKMRPSLPNNGGNALVSGSGFLDAESDRFDAIEEASFAPKRGMVLPFRPLAIAFHNVNYYVDMPVEMKQHGVTEERLQLLHNISGAFKPGVLTALVGTSGAGKTTLMDVLAGRKTGGYIEGSISISGYPKNQETFARVAGYCEQSDIHSPYVTVYESLVYSAWLRLSADIDAETRMMFVEEVMDLVELQPLRNALVGLPGVDGLSIEQRKRLTVAVELVANPSIIFMDEPTSGLDARAAAIVMRTVRNTVDTGRTVVCTIHQPSIDIFEAFDELLLMKIGGQMIYAGPLGRRSQELVDYFEAVQGVPHIKEGQNPATWMLEVTATAQEARLGLDFAQVYKESALYQRNEALIQELSAPANGSQDFHFSTKYSQSFLGQCWACLWKQNLSYWRNPEYNVIRLFFTLVASLLLGTMFWDLGQNRETFQDILNLMGILYISLVFIGFSNSNTILPVVGVERTVFYRERGAGMYSAIPYALGQVVIELPYVLLQTLMYTFIVYSMIGFEWTAAKFLWFFLFMYLTMLYMTYFGMMALAFSPNFQLAAILIFALLMIWSLFSGFIIPRPSLPIWWRWNFWATPLAWTLYGVIGSQLGDVTATLKLPDGTESTVKKYLEDYFGYEHDFLGWVAVVHVGLVLLFALLFAVCIKYLNFQRR